MEGHIGSYINSKLVADPVVKEGLVCAEEREGQWVKKSSTIIKCKEIFDQLKADNFVPTEENTQHFQNKQKTATQIIAKQYMG